MSGILCGIGALVFGAVMFYVGRMTAPGSNWIEPTTHDIGILPGGQIIHYSVCWCKQPDRQPVE